MSVHQALGSKASLETDFFYQDGGIFGFKTSLFHLLDQLKKRVSFPTQDSHHLEQNTASSLTLIKAKGDKHRRLVL